MKVIDCRCHLVTKELLPQRIRRPEPMSRYGEIYHHRNDADFMCDSPRLKGSNFWEALTELVNGPSDGFIELLDDVGVERVVFTARDARSVGGSHLPNEVAAEWARKHPGRVIAFAGVDPGNIMAAVRELERAVKELGCRGMALSPWEFYLFPSDRRLYPLYAKCAELNIPVMLHASVNFSSNRYMEFSNPTHLDMVACDFPHLKIIANHGGWPWVTQMVALVWRHANVYICYSSIRPRYLGMAGSGWETLVHFGNTVIQDKVLYGSGWPNLPFKRGIEETMQLPLKPEVREKWLYKNAARLFDLG